MMKNVLSAWINYTIYMMIVTTTLFNNSKVLAINPNEVTQQPQCPYYINDEIQRCVQPVADYAKVLNQQENSSAKATSEFGQAIQLPKLGKQVFRKLCGLIRSFEFCIKDHRHKCKNHITINLIEASYGFLCNDGYDTFMNSAECLMELDQRPSVKRCHDETLRSIEKANGQDESSMTRKLEKMCSALNSFSGCVMNPIRRHCGLDAWQVIFRVLKDTTRTLMPTCQFSSSNSAGDDAQVVSERNPSTDGSKSRSHNGRKTSDHHHRNRQLSNLRSTTPSFASLLPMSETHSEDFKEGAKTDDWSGNSQPKIRHDSIGEGRLKEIQVEVGESHQLSSEDDLYRPSNHRRKTSKHGERSPPNSATIRAAQILTIFLAFAVQFFLTF